MTKFEKNQSRSADPTVSVIVPTHNRAEFLGEGLTSLLAQTHPPDEIVVVNDASTDDTSTVLDRFEEQIERIDLVENHGKAASLNAVIPDVKGEYVWLFDDDDVALPDALERHLAKLAAEPDLDFTYSDTYHSSDSDIWNDAAWQPNRVCDVPPEGFLIQTLFSMNTLMQGMLIRRASLEAIGMFDPAFDRCQDLEMLIRLAADFKGAKVDSQPTFVYREHDGSRGGVLASHAGTKRRAVSDEYRKRVFRKAREELSLDNYLQHVEDAAVASSEDALATAALVQRGCLMVHQGLVSEGLEDLEAAFSSPDIDAVKTDWLNETLSSALDVEPWMFESRRRLVNELARILDKSCHLSEAKSLARGLYWSARREIRRRPVSEGSVAALMLLAFLGRCGLYGARQAVVSRISS